MPHSTRLLAAAVIAGLVAAALPARAERAACEELLAARARGQSDQDIAATYQTTRARLSACERIAEHRGRLQAQREDVAAARAERAAARGD